MHLASVSFNEPVESSFKHLVFRQNEELLIIQLVVLRVIPQPFMIT